MVINELVHVKQIEIVKTVVGCDLSWHGIITIVRDKVCSAIYCIEGNGL